MQNRVKSHPAAASPSSSSGGDGSGFCLSDIMDLDAGSGGDHKALGSPRSKHSATEQRRRCKINERFQMLRDLVPQSDQKRDRATFLLEVIEYVKFLQEKVQKHESCTGGDWSQEKSKLSNNQMPVDLMPCEAPATTYCSPPDFLENSIPAIPEMLQNAETLVEPARLNAALTDAMENLGIDLSQASVTVHVNLGRRAMFRRPNIMSSAKEQKGMPAI